MFYAGRPFLLRKTRFRRKRMWAVGLFRRLRAFTRHQVRGTVELLIGANVPEALQPKEIIRSQNGGPYMRVELSSDG